MRRTFRELPLVLIAAATLCMTYLVSGAAAEYKPFWATTDRDVIAVNKPDASPVHAFYVGAAANGVIPDSDIIESVAGGSVLSRYTYRGAVSLEGNTDLNDFEIDDTGISGDMFAIATTFNVLLHIPLCEGITGYVLGGCGFQLNDADGVEADVNTSGLGGKVVIPPDQAAVDEANSRFIEAVGRRAAAEGAATAAETAGMTGSSVNARARAEAAAADEQAALNDLQAAQQTRVVDVDSVTIPAGTMVDIDIEDGFISTVGAGVDVTVAENFLLNFEARFQFAEFDLTGSTVVPGLGTVKIDSEEDFNTLVLRAGGLLRF